MSLAEQLRQEIRAYVEGPHTLTDLRGWLADHLDDIVASIDPEVDQLDGRAWVLISEFDYGHRTEDDVKVELSRLLYAGDTRRLAPQYRS